jgi:Flp pilus assembly protein TadG
LKPRSGKSEGQALVEFALVSVIFLSITIGSVDVGRAVFMYQQMHNAVRDAARVVKVYPGNGQGALNQSLVETFVYNYQSTDPADTNAHRLRPGMSNAVVSYTCSAGCAPSTGTITITAKLPFTFVIPAFLKLPFPSFTMTASATYGQRHPFDSGGIVSTVTDHLDGNHIPTGLSVTTSADANCNGPGQTGNVQVTASKIFTPLYSTTLNALASYFGGSMNWNINLSATSTMRCFT